MPASILIDLTHTSHTRAHTGIQRLCRSLHLALRGRSDEVVPVCHDPYASIWRPLRRWERENLAPPRGNVAATRGSRWPLHAKIGGRLGRWLRAGARKGHGGTPSGDCLIEPEIFSPAAGRALPALFAGISGPRVALFHDAAALRAPELAPPKTVARYPAYLQELLRFDGIAAISAESRDVLVEYWRWLGVASPPPVVGLPLGVDRPAPTPFGHTTATDAAPVVLCVGSIEGRKNHLALLEACETLWQRGLRFDLQLIGLAQPATARPALERIRALQSVGRPLHYDGPASESGLAHAYRSCAFTVYPSLMEGFGFPVLESLGYGKPCISSAQGALGESTRGGGCLALPRTDAPALAEAIALLLSSSERLETLAEEAKERTVKTWPAYAQELLDWAGTLKRRDA
jgi:glycosyltransferase involved in cell wall biosynthesis